MGNDGKIFNRSTCGSFAVELSSAPSPNGNLLDGRCFVVADAVESKMQKRNAEENALSQ
jgi:hypothetical protein